MARKPKTQPSPEAAAAASVPELATAPARRGRRPKAAAPSPASLAAASIDDPATDDVEADAVTAGPTRMPDRRGPGRKPKQRAGAEAAALPRDIAVEQADAMTNPSAAGLEQVPAEDDVLVAEMSVPLEGAGIDGAVHGAASAGEAISGAVSSATGPGAIARAAPAARWDRTTDAAEFNWFEIERVAAHDGPNQAMAKLLVAARAEGASSHWPL